MEEHTNPTEANTTTSSANILCLDDDSFLEIFNHLELIAQVRLAMQCPRLGSVFQLYCKRRRKVLKKDDLNDMTRREVHYFFRMAGAYLEELINLPYKDHERNDFVTWVQEFCPNIRRINFSHTKIKSKCLRKILSNMRHVTSLVLVDCSLDDKAMLGVAELSKLEFLELENELNVTGSHLGKLKNLKELRIDRCGIEDKNLIEICRSSQHLRKLEIKWCNPLTNAVFPSLSKCCMELETVILWGTLQYAPLARLPKLKSLEVGYDHSEWYGQLIAELAWHKSEQLQCLRIYARKSHIEEYIEPFARLQQLKLLALDRNKYLDLDCLVHLSCLKHLETISLRYCVSVTDYGVLTLLKGCTRLKYINVMYCDQLTELLVYDVIRLLRKQLNRKERKLCDAPILMLVAGTQIKESILEDLQYLAGAELLRLNFIAPCKHISENRYSHEIPIYGEMKHFY